MDLVKSVTNAQNLQKISIVSYEWQMTTELEWRRTFCPIPEGSCQLMM